MKPKEKGIVSLLAQFASTHKSYYVISVIVAILGVGYSIIPYIIIADIIVKLIDGNRD